MPKQSYTLAFKKNAVEMAKKSNNRTVARDLGVDEKRIREWRSLASRLEEMTNASVKNSSKRFRLQGGGRKPLLQDIEQTIADWVVQQRMAYHRVTRRGIAMKAQLCGLLFYLNNFLVKVCGVYFLRGKFDGAFIQGRRLIDEIRYINV